MSSIDPLVQRLNELSAQGAPKNRAQFERRLESIAEVLGIPVDRARRLLAAVIVAQMLPADVVVKGGIGVKIRVGETGTRATRDLDVAATDRDRSVKALTDNLEQGWGEVPATHKSRMKNPKTGPRVAFFGTVKPRRQATPTGVPPEYVMKPYVVSLYFLTHKNAVASVLLEIGVDEFDGNKIAPPTPVLSEQVKAAVAALGCGAVKPVSVISIEQQLAQKIHAVTDPAEDRGHDLVDIQVLWREAVDELGGVDLSVLADLCRRTFAYRSTGRALAQLPPHTWPPDTEHVLTMNSQYAVALDEVRAESGGLPSGLASDVIGAERWLREVINVIDAPPRGASGGPDNAM